MLRPGFRSCFTGRGIFVEVVEGGGGHEARVVGVGFVGGCGNYVVGTFVGIVIGFAERVERCTGCFLHYDGFGLALGHILGYEGYKLLDRFEVDSYKQTEKQHREAEGPQGIGIFHDQGIDIIAVVAAEVEHVGAVIAD